MENAQIFCDLAYEALSREEKELATMRGKNSGARPLSICGIGEIAVDYLIAKEALRDERWPRVRGEVRYSTRSYADICFVDSSDNPYASFELKQISLVPDEERGWAKTVQDEVWKHFHPMLDWKERYNALLITTAEECSKDDIEATVLGPIASQLSNVVMASSKAIQLNQLVSKNKNAKNWKFLRIVVWSGVYTITDQSQLLPR